MCVLVHESECDREGLLLCYILSDNSDLIACTIVAKERYVWVSYRVLEIAFVKQH